MAAPLVVPVVAAVAAALAVVLSAAPAEAASGGPDAGPGGTSFGYVWVDSIGFSGFYGFQDITGTGTAHGLQDGQMVTVSFPSGFRFDFFGTSYSALTILENGLVTFGGSPSIGNPPPINIPAPGDPERLLAPFWANHNPNCTPITVPYAGNIYSGTLGTAPQRTFIVQWDAVALQGNGGVCAENRNTFQLKLFEGTDIAEFHYQLADSYATLGAGASNCLQVRVGIEGGMGTSVTGIEQDTATGCAPNDLFLANQALRFFKDDVPNAQAQALATPAGTAVAFLLQLNDDPVQLSLSAPPANGALSGFPAAGTTYRWGFSSPVTYTPTPGFCGTDQFSYVADDGYNTASATVTVNVACPAPPVAAADTFLGLEDTPLLVAPPGVLVNDLDPDGDPLTAQPVTSPSFGTLLLSGSGGFTYTPNPDWSGTDSFTYRVTDGSSTSTPATVQIQVRPVNDAPRVVPGPAVSVAEDAGPTAIAWATGIDAGPLETGQTLTITGTSMDPTLLSAGPTLTTGGLLTFTPAPDAFGTTTFTFALRDNGGTADGGTNGVDVTVPVEVRPVNDAPSFSVGAAPTVLHDAGPQTLAGFAAGLSPGPSNEAAQGLLFNVSAVPATLFASAPTIDAAGTLRYTPAPGQQGTATVTATLVDDGGTADGGVDRSAQTFPLSVAVPPDAQDDLFQVYEDTLANPLPVLGNDADPHGDSLVAAVPAPPPGTLVAPGTPGAPLAFSPPPGFTGTIAFAYDAVDPFGATDTATVEVEVLPKPTVQMTVAALQGEACAGAPVRFRGDAQAPGRIPVRWTWRFDGAEAAQDTDDLSMEVSLRGSAPGVHLANATVLFNDGTSTSAQAAQSLVACPAPSAAFRVGTVVHLVVPFLDETTSESPVVSYHWTFGDGASSAEASPTHEYPAPGTYVVRLTVVAANGLESTVAQTVTIARVGGGSGGFGGAPPLPGDGPGSGEADDGGAAPPAAAPVNRRPVPRAEAPARVVPGGAIALDGSRSSDPDGDALTYRWTQVDGPAVVVLRSDLPRATVRAPTASVPVTLVFRLVVSDGQAEESATAEVLVGTGPDAGFDVAAEDGAHAFRPHGQGAGLTHAWDFGDGATSDEAAPRHAFPGPGTFVVRLRVADAGGAAESWQTVVVAAPAPAGPDGPQTLDEADAARLPGEARIPPVGWGTLAAVAGFACLLAGAVVGTLLVRRMRRA